MNKSNGWLDIASAPKDSFIFDGLHHYGTKIIVFDGSINTARWWRIEGDSASNFIDEGGRAIYPTHWMPLPAAPCPTCNDQGAVGNILNAEPCPDCTPPASAQDDAKDEDSIALDKLADYIADSWPDKKYGLEEICQRLHAMWPGEFIPLEDLKKNEPNAREALRALLIHWKRFEASDGNQQDAYNLLVKTARFAWQFAEVEIDRVPVTAPAAGDARHVLLTQALQELRQAFVIAVGDKSPFARIALEKADAALAASQQQEG